MNEYYIQLATSQEAYLCYNATLAHNGHPLMQTGIDTEGHLTNPGTSQVREPGGSIGTNFGSKAHSDF